MDGRPSAVPDDIAGIERWRRELTVFAIGQLGADASAAEDIVQDAYEHLMRRAIADAPPDHARAWLYAVVRSRCRDERERRRCVPLDLAVGHESPGMRPEDAVIAAAASHWMLEQVDALPPAERDAVTALLVGRSDHETGAAANARYQALHRARRRLRRAYDGAWVGAVAPVVVIGRGARRLAGCGHAAVASMKSASVGVRIAVAGGAAAAVITAPVMVHSVVHGARHGFDAGSIAKRDATARDTEDAGAPVRAAAAVPRNGTQRARTISGNAQISGRVNADEAGAGGDGGTAVADELSSDPSVGSVPTSDGSSGQSVDVPAADTSAQPTDASAPVTTTTGSTSDVTSGG